MLGLYFYNARRPTLTQRCDLRDSSCRPDPDFEWLTLGLCRPGLRKRIAGLASEEPIDLLFYARVFGTDTLLLAALARIDVVYPSHADASRSFIDGVPRNLIVRGNLCLFGTDVDPDAGMAVGLRATTACGCSGYAQRANTPYLRLEAAPEELRVDDPVPIRFGDLRGMLPDELSQRWQGDGGLAAFQRATQNGAHWIRNVATADAIRRFFLQAPRRHSGEPGPAEFAESSASRSACGSERPTLHRKGGCTPSSRMRR